MSKASSLPRRRLFVLGLLITAVAGLAAIGAFTRLDAALVAKRMGIVSRVPTGQVAFVAIDKQSLDKVGTWPWDRTIYARLVDIYAAGRARDIFFDIDFSARSNPASDAAFAAALEAAGGGVMLPSFTQQLSSDTRSDATGVNRPDPMFAEHSWPASVSLSADADGQVRRFPYGEMQDGEFVMSVPATLAGIADKTAGPLIIDFSIDPGSVSRYSVIDVLEGRIDPSVFADKIVVTGASAIELKDNFLVPVHGLLSGPMVQILATETLLQDRALKPLFPWPSLAFGAIISFFALSPYRALRRQLGIVGAGMLVIEGVALWLQTSQGVLLPTAATLFLLLLTAATRIVEELDLRSWLLRLASADADNTRNLLGRVINDSADAILVVDEDGLLLEHSARLVEILPGIQASRKGDLVADRLPPEWLAGIRQAIAALRDGHAPQSALNVLVLGPEDGDRVIEYTITPSRLTRASGRGRRLVAHDFVACITARDVTVRRRQEDRITFLSEHDVLTDALRSSPFIAMIDAALQTPPPADKGHAVFAINLHRFKTINATLGRSKGDALLKAVVARLEGVEPRLSEIARLGGDTFAAFTTSPVSETEANAIAEKIVRSIGIPFDVLGSKARLGARIGMTFQSGPPLRGGAALVAEAELSLDLARQTSGNGVTRFDPETGLRHADARRIEAELWHALDKGEIHVLYQPQVRLSDRKLVGAEALIRWIHPKFGFVSPQDFVTIAEANGFIEQLGCWVLTRACRDALGWPGELTVAVNVAPLQFQRGDIVGAVRDALSQSGLSPKRLHLEITESAFLNPSPDVFAKMADLKALGISLALDDFGTGYSSFGYLARFPLDKIKVDQMFVRSLMENPASRAIVHSVKALCKGLGIAMICEGVETEEQVAFLKDIGCEQGQGYLFGKPQTSSDLIDMATGAREAIPA